MGIMLDAFPAAVIAFAFNEGAYCAETMRGALESVPQGQLEAGYCVGMSWWQIMRRIVLPQALRAAGMTVRPEDKEFIANFYKFAFVGLTLDWIKNDMRQDPAQLVEQLSTLIHGDVTKALEKCRIDKS